MTCSGFENVALNRVCQRRSQSVLVILELGVKLMKRALPQLRFRFYQERAERTLSERPFPTTFIDQDAEFHVHIGQLRKRVVVSGQSDAAEGEQSLFRRG